MRFKLATLVAIVLAAAAMIAPKIGTLDKVSADCGYSGSLLVCSGPQVQCAPPATVNSQAGVIGSVPVFTYPGTYLAPGTVLVNGVVVNSYGAVVQGNGFTAVGQVFTCVSPTPGPSVVTTVIQVPAPQVTVIQQAPVVRQVITPPRTGDAGLAD